MDFLKENLALASIFLGIIGALYALRNNIKKDKQERENERKQHEKRHDKMEIEIAELKKENRERKKETAKAEEERKTIKDDTKVLIAMQENITTLFKGSERVESKVDLLVTELLKNKK